MKKISDLKVGDRIYWIGEAECYYGIFEIKSILDKKNLIYFIPNNIIGDIKEVTILSDDYYCKSCMGLCYHSNKLFITIYANEEDFYKQLEILEET